jgi:hypothetical protein
LGAKFQTTIQMEKFRTKLVMVALAVLSLSFTMSSCSDDDGGSLSYGDPSVSSFVGTIGAGNTPITIAVTAPAGLKTVALNDEVIKTYTNGETSDVFVEPYEGTETDLTLTVTDVNGKFKDVKVAFTPIQLVDQNITADVTWTKDKRYLLSGNRFVTNGAKLTIEPGTVIYGDKATKGSLIIESGAQLIAAGTAAAPIVFTSSAPAGSRNYGDWGGLVILGNAKHNQNGRQNIEGITAGTLGQYGGDNDADNSGTVTYVRVEFAGIALSTDNELNGITFGSVGSGTTFHHVQVSYSGDDAFEWFGGKLSANHLISYRTWDDDFDTDFGFTGKVQFAAAFRDPNQADKSGSNLFESDNDGSGTANTPLTQPYFANVTAFGPFVYAKLSSGALSGSAVSSNYQNGGHIRRHSALHLFNSVVVGAGTANNAPFRMTDSKGGADAAALIKGNFVGRFLSAAATLPATGVNDNGYDVANFYANNTVLNQVNLSTHFNTLTAEGKIDEPATTATLAAGSPLATGAADLTEEGFEKTDYIGAVGTTAGWLSESWVNYNPVNTDYNK